MADRGRPRSFDRQTALAHAMEVFWAKGYERASMSDLTSAMGIASPSLYAAFGSKEALFREAVDFYGATEGPEIWAAVEAAPSARAAVESYLMGSAAAFSHPGKPRGCLVVLSVINADGAGDATCAELHEMRARSVADLERIIRQGIERGEVQASADARMIAKFFVTVQQGMSIQARDGASREALESVAKAAMAAWGPLTAG